MVTLKIELNDKNHLLSIRQTLNTNQMQPTIDTAGLKQNLGEKYSALVIDNPKDSVEHYINLKLQTFAELLADARLRQVTEHKLDGFLAMTHRQRLIVSVNDMHKRMMKIPAEYEPLVPRRTKKDLDRDIITSPRAVIRMLLIYGVPYTLLVLVIGMLLGKGLA